MVISRPFVHLHAHSAYSLLEGALPVSKLVGLAAADRMPALALTDTNNLFGALEFSELAAKAGIQPIIGSAVSLRCAPRSEPPGRAGDACHDGRIVLLAKDETGYRNLMRHSSGAFLAAGGMQEACVTVDELAEHAAGLIALTGGPDGCIGGALGAGNEELARSRLDMLAAMFGDRLYVEVQRHGAPSEAATEAALIGLAYDLGFPLVATNETYFGGPDDFEAHDALLCISEGAYVSVDQRRRLTPEHGFKTQVEMTALFADLPEALDNTIEIAMRCAFRPTPRAAILPRFVTGGEEREAAELEARAMAGLDQRLAATPIAEGHTEEEYRERLRYELGVITRMSYQGYFLIVADFIQWAKSAGIPVGPGRGSGAGSLVAWALTITDLDPLRFGLLFERFLNPERVSMPDFDIDFCQERRDEVIRYVQERYGADRVAQIITFGKLQARAVLRDVGRVLQMSYGQVDRLCKMVPNNPANPVTLPQAIAGEPRLAEAAREPIVAKLLDMGQRLEGLYRHASTHAAGIVIADRPMQELVPLYRDSRSALPATQFNMKWVEAAGLVKFDFLGLKTLTVIDKALKLLAARGLEIDFARLPLDDQKTYGLLARGDTIGVFQLEGSGMRDALRKLKPDRFEDIIAMVALYRPGPMDNIDTYVARKHGQEQAEELHPLIQDILEETYGVIIYQEQVMRIAEKLSGYSPGEADLLRRAMGKKIKAEMDQQKSRFIEGAVEKGVERGRAGFIFELVAKFAGYGFNKSHAAAYAVLAYQTAYLKANHPVEFLAASMTLELNNSDKLRGFVQEARRSGIRVEPPCVNASGSDFLPGEGAIRYSLAAVKTVGRQAVEQICAERAERGPFADVSDFAARLGPKTLNKRAVETLAAAGAFDAFGYDRAAVHANADRLLGMARRSGEATEGQNDLFGGEQAGPPRIELKPAERWGSMERLTREFDAVGFFLSGHPLDEYEAVLAARQVETWAAFSARALNGRIVGTLAGTVTLRQERKAKSGNRFAFIGFSDPTGQFEAVAFAETLQSAHDILEPGKSVLLQVEAEPIDDNIKVRIQSVTSLDAAMRHQAGIRVYLDGSGSVKPLADRLNGRSGKGEIRLVLRLDDVGREVEFLVPGGGDLGAAEISQLSTLNGVASVGRA